mgnify:FL=1
MSRTKAAAAPATLRQGAQAAGVSTPTASRVLNGVPGKAGEETVARVREAADRLAYRPLAAARDLRRGRGDLVALLAPNLANPTMAALAAAIEAALRQIGTGIVLFDTHDDAVRQDEAIAAARALRPRATVFLGVVASPGLPVALGGQDRPVFILRRPPGARAAPFIGMDDHMAGQRVAEALREAGCRRLAAIHGPLYSSATSARLDGFRAAAGRALMAKDVLAGAGRDHLEIGAAAARALLRRGAPPDGVMCTSDLIAFAAHRVLAEAGCRLPALWGFDGGPLNAWVAPWLSSVVLPYAGIGAELRRWLEEDTLPEGGAILPFELQPARDASPCGAAAGRRYPSPTPRDEES